MVGWGLQVGQELKGRGWQVWKEGIAAWWWGCVTMARLAQPALGHNRVLTQPHMIIQGFCSVWEVQLLTAQLGELQEVVNLPPGQGFEWHRLAGLWCAERKAPVWEN